MLGSHDHTVMTVRVSCTAHAATVSSMHTDMTADNAFAMRCRPRDGRVMLLLDFRMCSLASAVNPC